MPSEPLIALALSLLISLAPFLPAAEKSAPEEEPAPAVEEQPALSVEQLAQREGVEMPICHCVYEVLYHGKPARDVVGELMNRSRKDESGRGWQYPN